MPRFLLISIFVLLASSASAQEYTISSGDTIDITVWERESLSGSVVVDANGYISLPPPIGSVKVSGLSATEISKILTERLEEYIKKPTVFVSVTPAQGFTVHVLGEVQMPNFYQVPEGTSVQEVITRAGGLTQLADVKRIRIISKVAAEGDQIQERIVDFSEFLENGRLDSNPILQSKDMLIVPRLSRAEKAVQTVTVIGAVNNRGTFSIEEPMSLIEILALAGWPSDAADTKSISILSIVDGQNSWKKVNLEGFLAGNTDSDNPEILPGQVVFVPKMEVEIEGLKFSVNVVGQVRLPAVYPIREGTRLFDAIYMAGGITEEADIGKVTIIHERLSSPDKVEIDLRKYLVMGDLNYNPELLEGDTVIVSLSEDSKEIPGIHTNFSPSIRVSIMGEVVKPETYQVSPDSNILDVLKLAGGPTTDADLGKVTVIREQTEGEERLKINMEKVLIEAEFGLMPALRKGDSIFVPKQKDRWQLWRGAVRLASDIATLAIAYYIISGERFR